ncbi:MAG: copper chaperone PCu(A)C [Chloroflexi bacterium]|nr:copper chaperone PCu(A)C [Chloroflexota bacterium]
MKKFLMFALAGMLLLSACGASGGEVIEAHDPWARPAMKGENSAIYLLLHNHTAEDDELVSVSSDVAASVELHESKMVEGSDMMEMTPVASVPLPADGEVEFKPGGLHIMLFGLNRDLKVGDQFDITLTFKSGLILKVTVPVMENMDDTHMDGM